MNRKHAIYLALVLMVTVLAEPVLARGGRGGGGGGRGGGGGGARMGGGGGGARMGGGYGGGAMRAPSAAARPAPRPAARPSVNRSPSMSRPAGAGQMGARPASRPAIAGGGARPGAGNMAARPSVPGTVSTPGAGQSAFRSSSSFNRPSQSQVSSFLSSSAGAAAGAAAGSFAASRAAGGPPSAGQLPGSDGPRSFTTEGGTTITVGGGSGSTQVGGGTVGGAVGGIKVETAGGATYGKVGGAVGASGASGAAVRTGSVAGAQGARGSIANVSRGYADTAGNVARGSATVAQNRAGYTAANVRGGYASGGVGQIGSVSGVRGPGGNVVTAGRGASFVNGQFVGGQSWAAVNGAYTRWNAFTPGWYGGYPGAWWPGKWAVATTAWAIATWPYASAYCGCGGEPAYYDYGSNVAYEDGQVYVDDQPVATAEEYYNQANEIAATGAEATNEEWLPLGVFAVIAEEGQTQTDKVIQLALNRDGVIRGNYQDVMADKVTPIVGAVDKATQRVSMKLEGNDQLVLETGLYNLTNDEIPVLVHFGPDRQEGRVLIRLKQPEQSAAQSPASGG
ncbi:MAG: hypothetical protein IT424_00030 [Pirellulales bacterium]|nr:hypothetical protein [Pirellulales bacterium]